MAMWLLRCVLAACTSLSLCWFPSQSLQAQSSEFDAYFETQSNRYLWGLLPDDDWRWLKSQAWQESRLDPEAVSPAGAAGIMQIMPGTAPETGLAWIDRYNAALNIKAGAKYLRKTTRMWWLRPTRLDRLKLGWCGYNAGNGNCLEAQVLCGGASLWEGIMPCLPDVTGRHAAETINYVRLILKWYGEMTE